MKFWKYCTFSLLGLMLSGCSTSTLFSGYPAKMSNDLHQINQGQYQQCITMLSSAQKSHDYELYAAELGRVQQLADNYAASSATFMPLMSRVADDQLQAKIRGSRLLVNTSSLLLNDNLLPYQLSGYEIVFLYQYQALNFLAQGDISNALVALRKANNMQTYLAQAYQKQLIAAQAQAKKYQLNFKFINDQSAQFKNTLMLAASVKDSYVNAMSYYLSGLLFLATHDLNDAAVAFEQAASIMPNNSYIQNILLTTLQMQGASRETLANYQKAFGLSTLPSVATSKAHVTVMYEQNFVSPRVAVTVPIFIPMLHTATTFSFPAYTHAAPTITPLIASITNNNKLSPLANTQLIVNTNALAAKDLSQQYPIIFIREALRVMLKMGIAVAAEGNQQSSNLAVTAVQLYSLFTDTPDLRSWLTLPQDIQIGQYDFTAGTYEFHLSNGNLSTDLSQDLKANQYYLIWVTQYGQEFKAKIFQL